MTRIISGTAGSLRLTVPKSGTRPTSDRVREAIFSSLDALDMLSGAHVLDLYAGSGALGLEAASRGATEVVLVDKEGDAVRVAKNNARIVQEAFSRAPASASAHAQTATRAEAQKPKIEVVKSSVATFLAAEQRQFDLVFVDPPYELGEEELAANLVQIARITQSAARLVVERSSRSPEPIWPDAFGNVREKRYGETTVWTAFRTAGNENT